MDMFAPQGPLNMFKPLKTSNKKTPSIFKNHIKDMLRIASQSYIEKQGKGEASLHYEVLGNELFEAFNASETLQLEIRFFFLKITTSLKSSGIKMM